MAGIRVTGQDGVLHQILWSDPDEVPVVFIVVKEGATALAHPDYVAGTLFDICNGAIQLNEAWDALMVKTPTMPHPEICRVRLLTGTESAAEILVGSLVVHRFS